MHTDGRGWEGGGADPSDGSHPSDLSDGRRRRGADLDSVPGGPRAVLRSLPVRRSDPRPVPPPFVHLGARSAFSLGHALARPEELARQAAHLGQGALALADTMSLAGAPAFFAAARRLGIKPIPALDVRVRRLATSLSPRRFFRVRLLAEDATGWQRLVRLVSLGTTREVPHLTWDEVLAEPAGLVFLPGGLDSELAEEGNPSLADDAQALLERLVSAAGNDAVAIAIPSPSAPGGARAARLLAAMAAHFQLPAVAVPDADVLHPEDGLLLELLRRDASSPRPRTLGDLRRPNAEIPWLRPADDVAALYGEAHAVAVENAALLADRCEGAPPAATGHRFPLGDFRRGEDPDSYLWNKCFELAAARHGERPVRWRERLNREFQQLTEAGLVDAVLFAARLHQELEERGIVRGPGAGILSNSLAASLLGLTQVDPLQFDLSFEPPEGKARRAPRV